MSEIADWRPEIERGHNYEMNRIHNCKNPGQGSHKKVVCCCTAGLLRSPTAAYVLGNAPYNYNTRACGLEESFALVPLDKALAYWADEIVVMTKQHKAVARMYLEEWGLERPIICLNISDDYGFKDPDLVQLIKDRWDSACI